jgi:HEAT repeat protein
MEGAADDGTWRAALNAALIRLARRLSNPAFRLLCVAVLVSCATSARAFTDIITGDAARFTGLLASPVPERRIEGLQGLSDLKHWPAEDAALPLLDDHAQEVRRAAVLALGRIGGARTIPRFIALLDDPSWELRQHAWLNLRTMTTQEFPREDRAAWQRWWQKTNSAGHVKDLLAAAQRSPEVTVGRGTNAEASAAFVSTASGRPAKKRRSAPASPVHPERREALRALARLASPEFEPHFISLLRDAQTPPLDAEEHEFLCAALERAGSARAVPVLAAQRTEAAAWALGHLGGHNAERALLNFPPSLAMLLALDRLRSTNAGPLLPQLVAHMGQITYRGQPDDVMNEDLQPVQRVGANLILRSGLAPAFIERAVQELEDTMKPAVAHGPRPDCPPQWERMFTAMRSELKPGFVREDGTTTTQPVVAMCYLLGNASEDSRSPEAALIPRLIRLLRHPAVVPRVYVALALGRMQAREAAPELVALVREGYAFSDSTALASGKHFDQSQNVRWRGFLCLALGRMGDDEARMALEQFATDAKQPRDIRYSAMVGLGFIGSTNSSAALTRVATDDIVWLVRDEARQAAERIQLMQSETTR